MGDVSCNNGLFIMNDVGEPNIDLALPQSELVFLQQNEGSFFHKSQQSGKMQSDMRRRSRLLYEQRRRAYHEANRRKGIDPIELPMFDMNGEQVTLCMEISRTDHVEMIANRSGYKGDDTVSRIMAETNTMIEFPDREDQAYDIHNNYQRQHREDTTQFMNQITITGLLKDVNEARIRLRRLCPLTVCFPIVETSSEMPLSRLRVWLPGAIKEGVLNFPNINIQILPPSMSPMFKVSGSDIAQTPPGPVIRISGRMCNANEVLKACETLREKIFDEEVAKNIVFSSHMDIPTSHWKMVVGDPDGSLMVLVSKYTEAHLHFPGHSQFDEYNPFTGFFCTGKPEQVINARKYIQGLLPLQLCFDVDDDALVNSIEDSDRPYTFYDKGCHVTIKIVRSNKEPSMLLPTETRRHFVQIVTAESNASNLFTAYRRSFKNNKNIPDLEAVDYNFMEEATAQIAPHVRSMEIPCRMAPRLAETVFASSVHTLGQDSTVFDSSILSSGMGAAGDLSSATAYDRIAKSPSAGDSSTKEDIAVDVTKMFDYDTSSLSLSHNTSYLGDRSYHRENRFNRNGAGGNRFNREQMRRHHNPADRRFTNHRRGGGMMPFGQKNVLPLRNFRHDENIPNEENIGSMTRVRDYSDHQERNSSIENVAFCSGGAHSMNGTHEEIPSSLLHSNVSSRCPTPNGDRKRNTERRYSGTHSINSCGDSSRRGPLRQRNYPDSNYYNSGFVRRHEPPPPTTLSLRKVDENNRPMKIELQYRAPAQRNDENDCNDQMDNGLLNVELTKVRSTLPSIPHASKESLLPTPSRAPLSQSYSHQSHSTRQSHPHENVNSTHQPRSYADIARKWEPHGMNVMDLIKLASEDPQSRERSMDLRRKEGERDECTDNEGMSYAQVLEGRRQIASSWPADADNMHQQWMPYYTPANTKTTKALPISLTSSRRSSASSLPSAQCLPAVSQQGSHGTPNPKYTAMETFLAAIRCSEYTECFVKHQIEVSRMYTLGDEDLQRIGVRDENARRNIQRAAQQIYFTQHLAGGSF